MAAARSKRISSSTSESSTSISAGLQGGDSKGGGGGGEESGKGEAVTDDYLDVSTQCIVKLTMAIFMHCNMCQRSVISSRYCQHHCCNSRDFALQFSFLYGMYA